nr:HAD hydrolase family protein [Candidatus Sigynarchaeota archaeon]
MPLNQLIKAVIIDIDGCLTSKTFGQPLDLESLRQIQEISQQYKVNPAVPMLILNTGRDANHTELMAKILDSFHYFIIEMGAAIVSVHGAELVHHLHKSITRVGLDQFDQFQSNFLETFPQYQKYLQYGKRYMASFLFENDDRAKEICAADLRRFIQQNNFQFHVDQGHNFINIIFPDINKGSGLELLFEIDKEFNHDNVAGIGDSPGDWDFLKNCAFSACPANAADGLKKKCDYVAINQEAKGTLEILRYILKRNVYFIEKQSRSRKKPTCQVKAIISDINGTIDSAIYGNALNLEGIAKIRDLIERSAKDPAIPRIFMNTGWDLSYTILYAQLLNNMQYHVIERGAAIVSIDGPFVNVKTDSKITPKMVSGITLLQANFMAKYPHYYRFLQFGKKYMLSFQFEIGSIDKEECLASLKDFLSENKLKYEIDDGPNYINVGVPGIDKGTGADLLLKTQPDLRYDSIVGVGDSDGDWAYIKKCGYKACPSNASKFLKEHCDYVASKAETDGFIEILQQIIQWNLECHYTKDSE